MLFGLLCIYIVFYYVRPLEWVSGLAGSQIFQVIGVISVCALFNEWLSRRIQFYRYRSDTMMTGFVVAMVISNVIHGNFGVMLESLKGFFPVLVGYFLIANSLNSRKRIENFTFLLILLTVFLASQAILEAATGSGLGGIEPILSHGSIIDGAEIKIPRARWYGVFNDPNDLGLALVMVVPFLVNDLFNKKWLLPAACLPILLCGLYWTNSRGAVISLLVSLFSYCVLRFRSANGVFLGMLLGTLLLIFGPSRMSDVSSSGESAYGRIEAWYQGFQMLKCNPLFGVGKGMFTDYHRLTAHNSYILVLAELGLVGSFFFVGLFHYPLLWAKKNFSVIEGDSAIRSFNLAIVSSLIGIMTAMFFLSRAYILVPFLLIALISASINEDCRTYDDVLAASYSGVVYVTLCQATFLYIIVTFLL